ncbi:hypothetical protein PAXINDRAFT_152787 [Paxillus involutus ATCC 200175]|nr:hypothetical protein PAXINDRAFT_152787 [Paxillus involutus ATCC 200175]
MKAPKVTQPFFQETHGTEAHAPQRGVKEAELATNRRHQALIRTVEGAWIVEDDQPRTGDTRSKLERLSSQYGEHNWYRQRKLQHPLDIGQYVTVTTANGSCRDLKLMISATDPLITKTVNSRDMPWQVLKLMVLMNASA